MGSKPDMMYIAGSGALVGRDSICLSMIFYRTIIMFSLFAMQLDYCNIQRVFNQK